MFLRNAWYVAVWEEEVANALVSVELLDEKIVIFRKIDGSFAALEDSCPHRKIPLSMGRLKGDTVECGYHGLTFDGTGTCVRSPSSNSIPPDAKVKSYPTMSRYGLVWIWMGDPILADPALIVTIDEWGDERWGTSRGKSMTVDCNYLYLVDNLLDPTHVAWVHQSSFGNADCEDVALKVASAPEGVTVSRWIYDTDPAPFYSKFLKFAGRCDRKQHYEVRYPSTAVIKAVFTPAGTGGDDDAPVHDAVFLMDSYNFLTPVNDHQTRYFWFQLRNFAPDDAEVSAEFADGVRTAFEEDRVILNAVQRGMSDKRTPNIDLKVDLGSFRFRRGLSLKIDAEAGNAPGEAQPTHDGEVHGPRDDLPSLLLPAALHE
jgi:phenylpropionate dioxygenase-like ring-hydroxylating dioxygenase large terminal subunit